MQSADRQSTNTLKEAADLHWLAFLLTEQRDLSIDIAVEALAEADGRFAGWMRAWSRRIVIAKALTASRGKLGESARRTESVAAGRGAAPRGWSLDARTSKARVEEALLAIDLFPRAAVVLTILEGVPEIDATVLLDCSVELLRKGQAIGLRELVGNLADGTPAVGARGFAGLAPALAAR